MTEAAAIILAAKAIDTIATCFIWITVAIWLGALSSSTTVVKSDG